MIHEIIRAIGAQLRAENPQFTKGDFLCFTDSNKIINRGLNGESISSGIDDSAGAGFYIRLAGDITYSEGKRYSSDMNWTRVIVPLILCVYYCDDRTAPLLVEEKIRVDLKKTIFPATPAKNIRLDLRRCGAITPENTQAEQQEDFGGVAVLFTLDLYFDAPSEYCNSDLCFTLTNDKL